MKWWATLYILMLFAVPFGKDLALSVSAPWWTHLTYMYGHAGWMHYAMNGLGWLMMWKIITPARTLFAIMVAAMIPGGEIPVLGWSVVLYYYMGLCIVSMKKEARLRLLLVVAVGFLIPWIAAGHHALMLCAGWLVRKVEVKWLNTLR